MERWMDYPTSGVYIVYPEVQLDFESEDIKLETIWSPL